MKQITKLHRNYFWFDWQESLTEIPNDTGDGIQR